MRHFWETQRELGCQWAMAAIVLLFALSLPNGLTVALLGWGR